MQTGEAAGCVAAAKRMLARPELLLVFVLQPMTSMSHWPEGAFLEH